VWDFSMKGAGQGQDQSPLCQPGAPWEIRHRVVPVAFFFSKEESLEPATVRQVLNSWSDIPCSNETQIDCSTIRTEDGQ